VNRNRHWVGLAGACWLATSASCWPQVNLLRNGSFEWYATNGIPGCWSNAYGGTPAIVSGVATKCGDYVLRLVDSSSTQSMGLVSDAMPVTNGASYTAEAYVSRVETNGALGSLFLKYYDASGTQVGSFSKNTAAAPNTWDYLSVTGTAPASAATARVHCYSTLASTGTMYFDGVSFRLSPAPPGDELARYVAPAAAGAATGLSAASAAKYNSTAFWSAVKASLNTNSVKVIFLEGDYVMDTSADTLAISNLGNDSHTLTLEGEHPFGSVFTRTDAAQTNDGPAMLHLMWTTNVVVRHLHWENDTSLPGRLVQYGLAIDGISTGADTRNISVQGCSFVGLSWNIYGAMGFHHATTHGGRVTNCDFVRGGYNTGFHMIYNAYGPYDLSFENNHFEDCTGAYLRLRGGCHEVLVCSNTFVSTASAYNQPFVQLAAYNNLEPGDETWGHNFVIADNQFAYLVSGGNNVAFHLNHMGFDPYRAPGLLWDYLLTTAEATVLNSGTVAARKSLVRTNFGLNFDTQIFLTNNVRQGFHASDLKLYTTSYPAYNYQDPNGVWHICPNYGGDGTYDISSIVTQPVGSTTNAWTPNASGTWDNTANWSPAGVPNGIGSLAILTNNIASASRTNTLDTDVTLGRLRIGSLDGATNFVLEASGGSVLTFDNRGAGAEIIATSGNASDSLNAPIELDDDLTVTNTKPLRIRGVIRELGPWSGYGKPRSLTKTGNGTLTLSGTNTCTGPTTVSAGTLALLAPAGATSLLPNSVAISVSAGATLDASKMPSGFVVGPGQSLSGSGTLTGSVTVAAAGLLLPGGSNLPGALTFKNALTLRGTTLMRIDPSNGTNDALQGISTLTYGGTLIVTNFSGTNRLGHSYKLFSAATFAPGSFSSTNLPLLASGLKWAWIPANGTLAVVADPAATPTNICFALSGNTLVLSWPDSHLGWMAQSNALDLVVSNHWFDIPGSQLTSNLNILLQPGLPRVFYRLRKP
jgi:autotransporter-associated beta strand protein